MDRVELRDLRVFLAVAEELHFGRAANRLGITTSRVSQTVAVLERRLGGRLFDRTSRRVTLTPYGVRVRELLGPALLNLDTSLQQARSEATEPAGTLRIGVLIAPSAGPELLEIVDRFQRRHPACAVQVLELSLDDPLGPLRRGEIDLMTARPPLGDSELGVGPVLSRDARTLAVASGHPLASRTEVTWDDVADYAVVRAGGMSETMMGALNPSTTPGGRPIRRTRLVHTPHEMLAAVAQGDVVHPTVVSLAEYYGHPGVVYVPIADTEPSESALIYPIDSPSPNARAFLTEARNHLARPAATRR